MFAFFVIGLIAIAFFAVISLAAEIDYRHRETEAMRQYRAALDYLKRTSRR